MDPERVSAPVSSAPSAQQDSPPWVEQDESSFAVAPRLILTSGGGLGAGIDFGYFVSSGIGVGSTFSAYHFDNGAEWYCRENCFRSIVTSTAFVEARTGPEALAFYGRLGGGFGRVHGQHPDIDFDYNEGVGVGTAEAGLLLRLAAFSARAFGGATAMTGSAHEPLGSYGLQLGAEF